MFQTKRIVSKLLSLTLAVLMCLIAIVGCGKSKQEEINGDAVVWTALSTEKFVKDEEVDLTSKKRNIDLVAIWPNAPSTPQ